MNLIDQSLAFCSINTYGGGSLSMMLSFFRAAHTEEKVRCHRGCTTNVPETRRSFMWLLECVAHMMVSGNVFEEVTLVCTRSVSCRGKLTGFKCSLATPHALSSYFFSSRGTSL